MMRTLKYAILGLLMQSPMTGYDIYKAFGSGLGSFWSAKHSQIYPELKRLTEEGLVRFTTVIQGEKMEKKVYEITEQGKEDFLQWLSLDPPLEPTAKDVFRLRSYYSQWLPEETYLELIHQQMIKHTNKLNFLIKQKKDFYSNVDPVSLTGEARGDYLVLTGAIMRENAYLDWLKQSQELVIAWKNQTPSPSQDIN